MKKIFGIIAAALLLMAQADITLDGKPAQSGIYVNGERKVVIK